MTVELLSQSGGEEGVVVSEVSTHHLKQPTHNRSSSPGAFFFPFLARGPSSEAGVMTGDGVTGVWGLSADAWDDVWLLVVAGMIGYRRGAGRWD